MSDERADAVTTPRTSGRAVPRLAYSPAEAAQALGVSRTTFDEHILGELRTARVGRRILIARKELERWLETHSARALEGLL